MDAQSIDFSCFSRRGNFLEIIVFLKEKPTFPCLRTSRNQAATNQKSMEIRGPKKALKKYGKDEQREAKGNFLTP